MHKYNLQEIARESKSGFVLFILGYFANIFITISGDFRDNNLPLAIGMVICFNILVGIGIWIQAKSNVEANNKIKNLEEKIIDLEITINEMKTKRQ